MKQIINKTPHTIIVDGKEFLAEGPPIRIGTRVVILESSSELMGVPMSSTHFGEVENLPKMEEGIWYIVSSIVAQKCPWRRDFLIVGETTRNKEGQIIGCKSLSPNPFYSEVCRSPPNQGEIEQERNKRVDILKLHRQGEVKKKLCSISKILDSNGFWVNTLCRIMCSCGAYYSAQAGSPCEFKGAEDFVKSEVHTSDECVDLIMGKYVLTSDFYNGR